ncbi:FtsX-like permease family protein [Umezawaea endophytica]|uniref:ABC transporter permease n=1 Tax=Umezawaea endophytica TaxID=1654476 RepID=A0A9X2VKI9_9PSEU|nr:FtsX-like permease family protein [Umezawaea endophytica]MCS7477757.1 ABC transporter permease [Umezawaea endophytica]
MRLAITLFRGDRRGRVSAALIASGVAVGVLLVLWLLAAPNALEARKDRVAWREAGPEGSVTVASTADEFGGRLIARFDVASAEPGEVAVAQGIPRLPGPGEVVLSPALADLVGTVPAARLGDRFPGAVVGLLGEGALRFPDELVAIVGHPPGAVDGRHVRDLLGSSVEVDESGTALFLLTRIGLVVLVVPCLVLVASVGRLTAAKREHRLTALRLAGATPRQAVVVIAVEIAVGAVVGSALGVALAWPSSHLAALVPWEGGTWFPADFAPDPLVAFVAAVCAPVLVVGAAVLGHWRVVARAPGEVRVRVVRWRRLLIGCGAFALFFAGIAVAREVGGPRRFEVVLAGVAGVALALVFTGPVVTWLVGRLFVGCWRGPATLLAGRRLVGDPVAAFRGSAGVVIAVFTGSLALTMVTALERQVRFDDGTWSPDAIVAHDITDPGRIDALRSATDAPVLPMVTGLLTAGGRSNSALVGRCADVAKVLTGLTCAPGPAVYAPQPLDTSRPLRVAGSQGSAKVELPVGVEVRAHRSASYVVVDPELVPTVAARPNSVAVLTTPENRDTVHTALVRAIPGVSLQDGERADAVGATILEDLRRAVVIGLVIAALLGGSGAAVSAVGSVIDRRRTFSALVVAGTPVPLLRRVLRREVVLPVFASTLLACGAGFGVGLGLLSVTPGLPHDLDTPLTPWIAAPAAAGLLVSLIAATACGVALRGVTATTHPHGD